MQTLPYPRKISQIIGKSFSFPWDIPFAKLNTEIEFTLSTLWIMATGRLFAVHAIRCPKQKGDGPEHDTKNF